jgi:hypothetical protein
MMSVVRDFYFFKFSFGLRGIREFAIWLVIMHAEIEYGVRGAFVSLGCWYPLSGSVRLHTLNSVLCTRVRALG